MDNYSMISTPIGQKLEIYTELFVINGLLTLTSGRTSDVLNRSTSDFLALHDATITPLGQAPSAKPLDSAVYVKRSSMNFLAELSSDKADPQGGKGMTSGLMGREAYVRKASHACYAISGPYAIYGHCYLHQGTTLENLLLGVDTFFPITKCTVYVVNRPNVTWRHELTVVNKTLLTAMYLLPQQAGGEG